jgi:hypothetical protein
LTHVGFGGTTSWKADTCMTRVGAAGGAGEAVA